jgi:hypothetical protein
MTDCSTTCANYGARCALCEISIKPGEHNTLFTPKPVAPLRVAAQSQPEDCSTCVHRGVLAQCRECDGFTRWVRRGGAA